jgi:hypothetical protein
MEQEIRVFDCDSIEEAESKYYEMSLQGWKVIKALRLVWSWRKLKTVARFTMQDNRTSDVIKAEIDRIIAYRYNNYQGRIFKTFEPLHNELRNMMSDEKFLEHLKESELNNPRPVFNPTINLKK